MLDDLQEHQSILEKRGVHIGVDERIRILETLNARWELIERKGEKGQPNYSVEPVHNARTLLVLCLRNLGRPATFEDAQETLQDYYTHRYNRLLNSYDPYSAGLILWQRVLLTARTLGQSGERIRVVARAADTPDTALSVHVTRDPGILIEIVLGTNGAGAVVSTESDVVNAITASEEVSRVVEAALLAGDGDPVGVCSAAALQRGGPERPTSHEWKLFRALFLMDLRRYCWARGRRIRGEPPMVPLANANPSHEGDENAVELDIRDPQPSPEKATVRGTIRGLLRECLAQLRPCYLAVVVGHYVLGLELKDLVVLVPQQQPETSKGSKGMLTVADELAIQWLEDIARIRDGVRLEPAALDKEERDRRVNNLKAWLHRARRKLRTCLTSKGVSTVAGIY